MPYTNPPDRFNKCFNASLGYSECKERLCHRKKQLQSLMKNIKKD